MFRSLLHPATAAAMHARLKAVQPGDRARWGTMDATEMLCHLRGSFRGALGEAPCDPMPVPIPRQLFKALALWLPLPWAHNVKTVPQLERGTVWTATSGFTADKTDLVTDVDRFLQSDSLRTTHPYFGPMKRHDWMRWGYLHTDHHLRQFGR